MVENNIFQLVRMAEKNWISGETTHSKYVSLSMYETLNKIDAYLNSKFTSGDKDSKGREKPFFNIVTAAVNIWYRATDIDRKNIRIKATKKADEIGALLATIHLQEWMRKKNFGSFLNEWGRSLARYGSTVIKFIKKDGELYSEVIPWNRIICDQVDFENNPKIEKIWLTPAQLQQRIKTHGYNEDYVHQIISKSTITRTTADNQKKDNKADFIPIYEVHGNLSKAIYKNAKGEESTEEDETTYFQQVYVLCFLEKKEKGAFDDYSLYSGKEAEDPYMITHLIKEDGQTLSIGAVQHLFEAQWMVNHSMKQIKDQLDLASKLIFQTSDGNFVGKNALAEIETGDILVSGINQPITQVANNSHDITSLQSFAQTWQILGNQINGISESMMGQNPPSGTAWRQTQALIQQNMSLFELMTENKGLYIEDMLRKFIIPHLKTKMDTTEEVAATLEANQITQIDSRYIPNKAITRTNRSLINEILSGGEVNPEMQAMMTQKNTQDVQQELGAQGNTRYFKPSEISNVTWKEAFKDLEFDVECEITGEAMDKEATLASLTTAFQTIASLAGRPLTPQEQLIYDKIMSTAGAVSILELSQAKTQPTPVLVGGQGQQPK